MKCADVGLLRTYLDGELPPVDQRDLGSHLAECDRCGETLRELRITAESVGNLLSGDGRHEQSRSVDQTTRARLQQPVAVGRFALHRDLRDRLANGLAYSSRRFAILASAAAVLVMLMAFSPVRLAAEDFLGIFRVQRFAAITFDLGQRPLLPDPTKLADEMSSPGMAEVTLAVAAQQVDFPLKQPQYLPPSVASSQSTYVTKPAQSDFDVDLDVIDRHLAEAGAGNVKLPASLDGAKLRVVVPASVFTLYGLTGTALEGTEPKQDTPFLLIAETRGPTIEMPDSVDVDAIREQVLASPIVPPEIARQLAAIKDWRHTLIVPVNPGTHRDVMVSGTPGLLISHPNQTSTLLWQRDGVLFGLMSNIGDDEVMRVANSLR